MNKSSKIVATISDINCEVPFLQALFDEGVNVVRLNSAHMSSEGFDRVISNTRSISNHVAILMDTKGPEVRTTITDNVLDFKTGMMVDIVAKPDQKSTITCLAVNYEGFVNDVPEGAHILCDDGVLDLLVLEKNEDHLRCSVQNDATLGSRKSINVPGVKMSLPSLTDKDRRTIDYCMSHDVDFIAHSFVRSKHDVMDIQKILDEHNSPIKIISKIENQEGVDNIDEIIDASYGIMVARGDLGIEIAQEKIPAIQNMIIRKCVNKKKPVIVATQMLHSMITSPRPTRAEVSDVANAILSRTDAVMLSGETAYGKYPVEAVRTMSRIIHEAEASRMSHADMKLGKEEDITVTAYLSKQAVKSVRKLGVKAIITDSYSGVTARNLSAYRGEAPVFAICYNQRVARELALSFGVIPVYQEYCENKREYYIRSLKFLLSVGLIKREDMVAYVGGSLHESIGTTMLELNRACDAIDFFEEHSNER